MKKAAAWVEYTIVPSKIEGKWGLNSRTSRYKDSIFFCGLFDEEQLKRILSHKQFVKWKNGKATTFAKHLTVQERKDILKQNNEKK